MLIMAIAQRAGPFLIGNESGARNETGSQPGDIGGSLVTRRVEETKVALRELRVNDTFDVKRPGGVVDVADPTDHGRDDP